MSTLLRPGAHVDVFKRIPRRDEHVLVSTTRPCPRCGNPLTGLVMPYLDVQVHVRCPSYVDAHREE